MTRETKSDMLDDWSILFSEKKLWSTGQVTDPNTRNTCEKALTFPIKLTSWFRRWKRRFVNVKYIPPKWENPITNDVKNKILTFTRSYNQESGAATLVLCTPLGL